MTWKMLKPTRGTARHVEITLTAAGYTKRDVDRALRQFIEMHVEADDRAQRERLKHYLDAVMGFRGANGLEVIYDVVQRTLAILGGGLAVPKALRLTQSGSLNKATHHDELKVVDAYAIRSRVVDSEVVHTYELNDRYATLSARAAMGVPDALSELGIAAVDVRTAPVAFQTQTSRWNAQEARLERVDVPELNEDGDFDVVAYFESLRAQGLFPVASEEDVRRFVMALAAPLLRREMPGLLGLYWLHGPSGSGKDFLAAVLRDVWEAVAVPDARVTAEIRDPRGEEDRKTLGAHPEVLYVRLKEAGKQHPQMVESLIGYTGAEDISVRRLYGNEISVPNAYTWIADSVESPPERREISRRMVLIRTARGADDAVLRRVLDEIRGLGRRIVGALKQRIESDGPNALLVPSPGGRPLAHEVLANLTGASLDAVRGDTLEDLLRGILAYARHPDARAHKVDVERAKLPKIAARFSIFTTSHLVDVMRKEPGFQGYFDALRHGRFVYERVKRETNYDTIVGHGRGDFLAFELDGESYGIRFLDSKGTLFIVGRADREDASKFRPISRFAHEQAMTMFPALKGVQ